MQRIVKIFNYSLAILISLILLLLLLALSFDANTKLTPALNHTDIIKLKKTFSTSNPFKHQRRGIKVITLNEKSANQSVQFFLKNYTDIPVNINLQEGFTTITASPTVPWIPVTLFTNISFKLSFINSQILTSDIYLGSIPIPASFFKLALPHIISNLNERFPDYVKMFSRIENITFSDKEVTVKYQWDHTFARKAQELGKNLLLTDDEQKKVAIYYEHLSSISRLHRFKKISIHKLLPPLFQFAKKRVSQGESPIEENRAILLTLGIFASGVRINHLIKGENNKRLRHNHYGRLTLSDRVDLMRHFFISAALTVSTNKMLTDTIGLSKEIDDSDGGSGFSFADLLADRAGVAFARRAIDPDFALQFINQMAQDELSESDFMPSHKDLPESISALDFKKNYISIKNEKYLFLEKEISKRIVNLPLYSHL